MYNPVADLEGRAGVTLKFHDGPQAPFGPVRGFTRFSTLQISIHRDMAPYRIRCTLAHELVHLERGPVRRSKIRDEERAISFVVAKRLVDPDAFDALMGSVAEPTLAEVHRDLRVDTEHFLAYGEWRETGPENDAIRRAPFDGTKVKWPPHWLEARDGLQRVL